MACSGGMSGRAIRTLVSPHGPLWVVAGVTWWPTFVLFPAAGYLAVRVARPLLPLVSERKVQEEMAWTDHAAAMEEGIAARDDMRTSLGQAYVLRRSTALAAEILRRLRSVLEIETRITRRTGTLLHALLAGIAVTGVALVVNDRLSTGDLVTLFLVTSSFVGQVDMLARHLPDLQAGFGAVLRLRSMLGSRAEPVGGRQPGSGALAVEFRDLTFAYDTGTFALRDVTLTIPAGHTCALVGRTGSGKSTLASLLSRGGRAASRAGLRRRRRRGRPGSRCFARVRGSRHPAHRDRGRHAGGEHHPLGGRRTN
jgi:ATP-binding cassette subfamily B protein